MADTLGRTRSTFRFPRVEVDLAGIIVGGAGWLAYTAAWPLLASVLGITEKAGLIAVAKGQPSFVEVPQGAVLHWALLRPVFKYVTFPGAASIKSLLGYPGDLVAPTEDFTHAPLPAQSPDLWKLVVAGLVLLLLALVIAGAIARVYALRKARDESIGFDDAAAFSLKNLSQLAAGPFFMVAAVALFAFGGLACGALAGAPYAGPVLQVVAQPLAILAALVTTILVVGLVLGFPLYVCAVAVERNGSLDAVSRTYSYVFGRPVMYGVTALLLLAVAGLIEGFGGWFAGLARMLMERGANWSGGADLAPSLKAAFDAAPALATPVLPEGAGGGASASMWIAWIFAALTMLLLRGFIVSYVVGGFTDLYFMLREEVEGVPPTEVYVEGVTAELTQGVPPISK